MGRKASGLPRVDIVERRQKNGYIYVYERVSEYDKARGFYVTKHQKLLGKRRPDSDEILPTRPKAPKGTGVRSRPPGLLPSSIDSHSSAGGQPPGGAPPSDGKPPAGEGPPENDLPHIPVEATRIRYGAMAIAEHIGSACGIDKVVYESCDKATAQKIIALARFCLLTDGEAMSHLTSWNRTHIMAPYGYPISEDTAHNLFIRIGSDESISQSIFLGLTKLMNTPDVLAYDSTTVSTYGDSHLRSRYGFNKAKDGLETEKIFTFYSIDTRLPVCYTSVPGNIADVSAICNATKQLDVLGLKGSEVVTDCGFCSEDNLSMLLQTKLNFVTRIQRSVKWVRKQVDLFLEDADGFNEMCPFEPGTFGTTVCLTHEFTKVRKRGSAKKGLNAGDTETFTRRIYLHIYTNSGIRDRENSKLDATLSHLRDQILSGEQDFTQEAGKMIKKFIRINKKRNGDISVSFNKKAIQEEKKYNGIMTLVTSKEKDTWETLRKYRKRELIEDYFESFKQRISSRRYRAWDGLVMDGKKVVLFVALCYYEYFLIELQGLKKNLGKENGDPAHDLKENLNAELKLKDWLEGLSIQEIFDWYDAVERVDVTTEHGHRIWFTERTATEQMFLDKLGIKIPEA